MANELALRRLAQHGLIDLDSLWETVRQCFDHLKRTGDLRFRVVAEALERIAKEWDEDDALPVDLGNNINHVLVNRLPLILRAGTPEEGTRLAAEFAAEVSAILDTRDASP